MKKRTLRRLAPLVLVAAIVGAAAFGINWLLDQARAQVDIPHVRVTETQSGEVGFAGSHLPLVATATSHSPIVRVELWLNGDLKETKELSRPEQAEYLLGHLRSRSRSGGVTDGIVRATNGAGLIGESLPVILQAKPKPGLGDLRLLVIESTAGQTLADFAAANHSDPTTLEKLNPGLKDGPLPANASLVAPAPVPDRDDGKPISGQPPAPPAPPAKARTDNSRCPSAQAFFPSTVKPSPS